MLDHNESISLLINLLENLKNEKTANKDKKIESDFCSKNDLAKRLGVSPSRIRNMMKSGILVEGTHYTFWGSGGHPRFYYKQILNDLKPALAAV